MDDKMDGEVRKAAKRAIKGVLKAMEQVPSQVIIQGNASSDAVCPVAEITEWLFHRRETHGNTND